VPDQRHREPFAFHRVAQPGQRLREQDKAAAGRGAGRGVFAHFEPHAGEPVAREFLDAAAERLAEFVEKARGPDLLGRRCAVEGAELFLQHRQQRFRRAGAPGEEQRTVPLASKHGASTRMRSIASASLFRPPWA
jgi:hypothetical protein